MTWWCISAEAIMEMLYKVKDGEDPDVVYLEYYANSEVEDYHGEE